MASGELPLPPRANPGHLVAYFGHHKCATQWMKGLVRGIGAVVGRAVHRYAHARGFHFDLGSIPDPGSTIVCYTNADAQYARVENLRGWHMVRDPRDIVVSSYFSHLHSHPTEVFGGADTAPRRRTLQGLAEYRDALQSVSKAEGIMLELERRASQFQRMAEWDYAQAHVLELRMEQVTSDPIWGLREITSFVGLYGVGALEEEQLAGIVAANDYRVHANGRARGEEDVTSHYRKGVPGDWKRHFGREHVAYFQEHYNGLLLQLGYEVSPDWG